MMFPDIETIPIVKDFYSLDDRGKALFCKTFRFKIDSRLKELQLGPTKYDNIVATVHNEIFTEEAALNAIFGRILCVSIGVLDAKNSKFRVKTIIDRDERTVLLKSCEILINADSLCAHNGIEFDYPFFARRCIIHGIPIPPVLNIANKKVYELQLFDTMNFWGHLQWKHKVALDLLAFAFGFPSPKEKIDGSMIAPMFYSEPEKDELPFDKDARVFKIIGDYCGLDVVTLANVFYRIKGLPIIQPENVVYVE